MDIRIPSIQRDRLETCAAAMLWRERFFLARTTFLDHSGGCDTCAAQPLAELTRYEQLCELGRRILIAWTRTERELNAARLRGFP